MTAGAGSSRVVVIDRTICNEARIPARVATSPAWYGLSGKAVRVYVALKLRLYGEFGRYGLTQAHVAELAGLPLSTTRKGIAELKAAGLLAVHAHYICLACSTKAAAVYRGKHEKCCDHPNRRQVSNVYEMTEPPAPPNPRQLELEAEAGGMSGPGNGGYPGPDTLGTLGRTGEVSGPGHPKLSSLSLSESPLTPQGGADRTGIRTRTEVMGTTLGRLVREDREGRTSYADQLVEAVEAVEVIEREVKRHPDSTSWADRLVEVGDHLAHLRAHPPAELDIELGEAGAFALLDSSNERARAAAAVAVWCSEFRKLTGTGRRRTALRALALARREYKRGDQ